MNLKELSVKSANEFKAYIHLPCCCAAVLTRGRWARRTTPEVRDCAGALQGSQAGSEGVPLPLS